MKRLIPLMMIGVSGCLSFTLPPERSEQPGQSTGYLFGEFRMIGKGNEGMQAGISISGPSCSGSLGCVLQFHGGHGAIYPIALSPGEYRMEALILLNGLRPRVIPFHKDMVDKNPFLRTVIKVKAGAIVYIGSFTAERTSVNVGNYVLNTVRLLKAEYAFGTAAERLVYGYPGFNGWAIVTSMPNAGGVL